MALSKLDKILLGNQYAGVELFSLNGEDGVTFVTIEKKNNELIISNKEKRGNFEKIAAKLNKQIPLFLVINNDQVIHKEIEGTDVLDSKLFHKAFPNINIEDFVYEIWRFDGKSIIAICRKNYIDELLFKIKEYGIQIASLSIGICQLSQIKDFLPETIKTNSQTISIADETILSKSEENQMIQVYEVNGLEVQNTYILAFSNVIAGILNNTVTSGNISILNERLFDNFSQVSFFRKGFRFIVYSLLVILLLNFFLFNYYFKKSNETDISIQSNKEIAQKIKAVSERLKYKEENLKNLNSDSNSKSSHLINEIIKVLPSSILLNELVYRPIEKKIKSDEKIIYLENTLVISGKTISSSAFTDWIERIEKLKWVKKTTIMHFGKNENNESVFTLKFDVADDEVK